MPEPLDVGTLSPEEFREVRRVFEAALERPASARGAFVEQACAGNAVLRAEVDRMLAAERQPHRLIDGAAGREAMVRNTPLPSICPSCSTTLTPPHKFCPACGTPVAADGVEGRFRAGALFANRFRIVAALGRGGMGDVYRAHDLELGQPVALKFLTALRSDERARARLRNEVRLARQLSHPNVCRVYDIGEAHGELYLSMEYVDGEDLAALLKRIGRLPVDKGVEIARKLCAGLAAAHAKGVLHRDFKPANIMIDAAGEVRIMDFGLAAIATELDAKDVRSGTPAYMAPEQLAGREATVQSDLYALGLVLYELFTGKAAFTGKGIEELLRQRESHPSTAPSSLIPDLGPRIERAILRCLEPDPKLRPPSAIEVSASLPGGDPLAEALAAGETPSPEMVAAAGSTEALRPKVAIALLVTIGIGLAAAVALTQQTQMVSKLPLEYPPEVLADRARQVARSLGYVEPPADVASGFRYDRDHVEYLRRTRIRPANGGMADWNRIASVAPSPLSFWYRQSRTSLTPRPLDPERLNVLAATNSWPDPQGEISMEVGLDGRLLRFRAQPSASETPKDATAIPDWSVCFNAAHLDVATFAPVEPQSGGIELADIRAAWTGTYPGHADLPIRVEAAAFRGRPLYFEVVFPWSSSNGSATDPAPLSGARRGSRVLSLILLIVAVVVGRHNWKAGRGDVAGAWRLGLYFSAVLVLVLCLSAHHVGDALTWPVVPVAVFYGMIFATVYVAVEPWVRRWWPQAIISWSRVLAGRWRDPVVGRDILVAVLVAVMIHCLQNLIYLLGTRLGGAPAGAELSGALQGLSFVVENLKGGRLMAAAMVVPLAGGVNTGVASFFILFLFRVWLRKPWLAAVAYFAFGTFLALGALREDWIPFFVKMIILALIIPMMLRFGLLALTAWGCVGMFMQVSLLTSDFGAWYGQSSLIAVIVVSVIALWAFHTSLGGRPLARLAADQSG